MSQALCWSPESQKWTKSTFVNTQISIETDFTEHTSRVKLSSFFQRLAFSFDLPILSSNNDNHSGRSYHHDVPGHLMAAVGGTSHPLCIHALCWTALLLLLPWVECESLSLDFGLGYCFRPRTSAGGVKCHHLLLLAVLAPLPSPWEEPSPGSCCPSA